MRRIPFLSEFDDLQSFNNRCCIPIQNSDLAPFLSFVLKDRDNNDITVIGSDVSLLFRLQKMREFDNQFDSRNLDSLLSRFRQVSPSASNLSDEELLSIVKSRYLQSPSEIQAWSDYLEQNIEMLVDSSKIASSEKAASEKAASEKAVENGVIDVSSE